MDIYKEFDNEMMEIYFLSKKQLHYNPSRFLEMLKSEGGYMTAKKLLSYNEPSEGFTKLLLLGRLDLTVEAVVVKDKYRSIFTEVEIRKCKERLGKDYLEFNNIK